MADKILKKNKSSRMAVGFIINSFQIESTKDTRYKVRIDGTDVTGIPLITSSPLVAGDKVIVLFEDSTIFDTPFIIGKYNQKTAMDEKLIKSVQTIEKPIDKQASRSESDNSFIQLDSKRKKITIANKDSKNGKIIIDEDTVYIGDINLTDFIKKTKSSSSQSGSDRAITSNRDLNFSSSGSIRFDANEANFLTDNFIIRNSSDFLLRTTHLNASASMFEFNVMTPKAYSLKEKNAFSFFAVDGDYSIALGLGDFNLKAIMPTSSFNFLLSPLTPFSGVNSSVAGMSIENTEILMGVGMGLGRIILEPSSFEAKILYGSSAIKLSSGSFGVDVVFGATSMKLSPTSFSVTIAGNKLTLSSAGLTVTSGNIIATAGDVKARGGTYSLMNHKHPTAVPGGPSPPLPG